MKAVIIAGNYHQYQHWIRRNNLNPRDYPYADRVEKIQGLRNKKFCYIGEAMLNPIYEHPALGLCGLTEVQQNEIATDN